MTISAGEVFGSANPIRLSGEFTFKA